MIRSRYLIAILLANVNNASGFSVPRSAGIRSFSQKSSFLSSTRSTSQLSMVSTGSELIVGGGDECLFTPEGYGFSSSADRILKQSESNGYYRAAKDDTVADVVEKITTAKPDVALVYDDETLVGIFTERDFIKFSSEKATSANTEEEAAQYLLRPIKDFVTPASSVVAISNDGTASQAIVAMQQNNIRHIVVADVVSKDFTLLKDSSVSGVVSMQDVMLLVQNDERLSLKSLQLKYPNLGPMAQMREQMKSDANKSASNPETAKEDVIKIGAAAAFLASCGLFLSQSGWLHDNAQLAMIAIFIAGYAGIIFEEVFELNKAGIALLMSTGLWITYGDYYQSSGVASENVLEQLKDQLAEVSDICFFLLAASAIVEVVDAHQGFKVCNI